MKKDFDNFLTIFKKKKIVTTKRSILRNKFFYCKNSEDRKLSRKYTFSAKEFSEKLLRSRIEKLPIRLVLI